MRPQSSKKKTPIVQTPIKNKTKNKNNSHSEPDDTFLRSSRNLNKTYDLSKSKLRPLNQPKVMTSLKTMGIIHAYRPEMLKECILH